MKFVLLALLMCSSSHLLGATDEALDFADRLVRAGPVSWSVDNEQNGRTCLLREMMLLASFSPAVIEEGFRAHAKRLQDDDKVNRVDEAVKATIICGLLFRHPVGLASKAGANLACPGMFFEPIEDIGDQEIEYMLPLGRKRQGAFVLEWRFVGYVGPAIPADWGEKYFSFCKAHYEWRERVEEQSQPAPDAPSPLAPSRQLLPPSASGVAPVR